MNDDQRFLMAMVFTIATAFLLIFTDDSDVAAIFLVGAVILCGQIERES